MEINPLCSVYTVEFASSRKIGQINRSHRHDSLQGCFRHSMRLISKREQFEGWFDSNWFQSDKLFLNVEFYCILYFAVFASVLASACLGTFGASLFNFLHYFSWLRITDEGSVPFMRIWSMLYWKENETHIHFECYLYQRDIVFVNESVFVLNIEFSYFNTLWYISFQTDQVCVLRLW